MSKNIIADNRARSLAKAVSWRATGSIDTFILSFVFTGSVKAAGSIASTELVTKIFLYYFHERAWNRLPFWRSGAAAPDVAAERSEPAA